MKRILTYAMAVMIGIVLLVLAFTGLWVLLGWASSDQLAWLSRQMLLFGGVGLLFMAGFVAGGMILAGRGGGGGGGGGEGAPVEPGPDPIDLELRRLLDEEAGARRPG